MYSFEKKITLHTKLGTYYSNHTQSVIRTVECNVTQAFGEMMIQNDLEDSQRHHGFQRLIQTFLLSYVCLFVCLFFTRCLFVFYQINSRALPDITSGPEVRQIFKIRTVWKPDVFLPGRRTFNTLKSIRKNPKKKFFNFFFFKFFFSNFFSIFFQIHPNLDFLTPNLCPWTLSYEN